MFPAGYEISGEITSDNRSVVLNGGDGRGTHPCSMLMMWMVLRATWEWRCGRHSYSVVHVGDETTFDLDAEVMADSSAGEVSDVAADDVASGEDEPADFGRARWVLGIAQSASVELMPSADPVDRCEASACETTLTINLENSGNRS